MDMYVCMYMLYMYMCTCDMYMHMSVYVCM